MLSHSGNDFHIKIFNRYRQHSIIFSSKHPLTKNGRHFIKVVISDMGLLVFPNSPPVSCAEYMQSEIQ